MNRARSFASTEGGSTLDSKPNKMNQLQEIPDAESLTPLHYLAVRSDGLTFMACVMECAGTPELVANVDRLWGTNLQRKGSPIDLMVDDACDRENQDCQTFLRFV